MMVCHMIPYIFNHIVNVMNPGCVVGYPSSYWHMLSNWANYFDKGKQKKEYKIKRKFYREGWEKTHMRGLWFTTAV